MHCNAKTNLYWVARGSVVGSVNRHVDNRRFLVIQWHVAMQQLTSIDSKRICNYTNEGLLDLAI